MKNLCCILSFLLIFSACKKDVKTHLVSYKVTESTPGAAPYTLRYSLSDGTLRTEGPVATEIWITESLSGFKPGAIVSLYLDSPAGSYEMYIYVDGELSSHAPADGGLNEQLLEAQIPN
jgi:hypothetical protein